LSLILVLLTSQPILQMLTCPFKNGLLKGLEIGYYFKRFLIILASILMTDTKLSITTIVIVWSLMEFTSVLF